MNKQDEKRIARIDQTPEEMKSEIKAIQRSFQEELNHGER